jgi:hypothetical protein
VPASSSAIPLTRKILFIKDFNRRSYISTPIYTINIDDASSSKSCTPACPNNYVPFWRGSIPNFVPFARLHRPLPRRLLRLLLATKRSIYSTCHRRLPQHAHNWHHRCLDLISPRMPKLWDPDPSRVEFTKLQERY